jgi:hypothetical protein
VNLINVGVVPGYRWYYMARICRAPLLGELFMATNNRPASRLALKHGNPRGLPRSASTSTCAIWQTCPTAAAGR